MFTTQSCHRNSEKRKKKHTESQSVCNMPWHIEIAGVSILYVFCVCHLFNVILCFENPLHIYIALFYDETLLKPNFSYVIYFLSFFWVKILQWSVCEKKKKEQQQQKLYSKNLKSCHRQRLQNNLWFHSEAVAKLFYWQHFKDSVYSSLIRFSSYSICESKLND